MFNGLQKIYWLNFKSIYSWEDFIGYEFASLKGNLAAAVYSQLFVSWNALIGTDGLGYIKLMAAIGYVDPVFYDEIVEKLKNKKPAET